MHGIRVAAILAIFLFTVSALAEKSSDPKFAVTQNIENNSNEAVGVTMHFPSVFQTGLEAQCWQCGPPCTHGACCNDGYPQCCTVNGVCKCCRG